MSKYNIWCDTAYLGHEGLRKGWNRKEIKELIAKRQFADYLNVRCGNQTCREYYLSDKYGIETSGLGEWEKSKIRWKNRESKKKWYICKGCKTTYYCSRRCQKKSWIGDNHRKHCQKLQKYQDIMRFR